MKRLIAFWKALRQKQPPDEEVATHILAHLAEHGRTRTFDLHQSFNGAPGDELTAERYTSFAQIFYVLERLEREGQVYGQKEMYQGRENYFWNIGFGGGKRDRTSARAAIPTGLTVAG